jgi:hypothetical protein
LPGFLFPTKQAAIVQGNYRLQGMKLFGLETSPAGRFVFHQRKQQGQWMISKAELFRQKALTVVSEVDAPDLPTILPPNLT